MVPKTNFTRKNDFATAATMEGEWLNSSRIERQSFKIRQ